MKKLFETALEKIAIDDEFEILSRQEIYRLHMIALHSPDKIHPLVWDTSLTSDDINEGEIILVHYDPEELKFFVNAKIVEIPSKWVDMSSSEILMDMVILSKLLRDECNEIIN